MTKKSLLFLPPNRVRRNYYGGASLDRMAGSPSPIDSDRPENWVCSLVPALNPGLPSVPDEGLSPVEIDGKRRLLRDVFADAPEHYLGSDHVARRGIDLGFLVKQLDSSMRLHLQAHPTREFARQHLGKPWGKFEAYVILGVRPGCTPYIRLGFQHPPRPLEWLRIVVQQDIAAMDTCFEPVPVCPGEVWFVPGGLPHAIGGGLTVLEIMEPSDLVVRCEFEREGIVVPPAARFMGREPADALRVFDYTPWPVKEVTENFRVAPERLWEGDGFVESRLIGVRQIDCFEVRDVAVAAPATLPQRNGFVIGLVYDGAARISTDNGEYLDLRRNETFFVSAAASGLHITPIGGPAGLHFCQPGSAA